MGIKEVDGLEEKTESSYLKNHPFELMLAKNEL